MNSSSKVINQQSDNFLRSISEIGGLTDNMKIELGNMLVFFHASLSCHNEIHHNTDFQITPEFITNLDNEINQAAEKISLKNIKDYEIVITTGSEIDAITPNKIFLKVVNNKLTYSLLNPYGRISKDIVLDQPNPSLPFTQDSLDLLSPFILENILKSEAIITFQRLRRMKLICDNFFSTHGRDTYQKLIDLHNASSLYNETNSLASHMIGKTVAGIEKKDETQASDSFQICSHSDWKGEGSYHRFDFYNNHMLNQISDFYKSQIQLQFQDGIVIPVSYINNSPIEEIINQYFTESENENIKIHKVNNKTICLIEIKKNKYAGKILGTLTNLGLILSPWEISQLIAKLKENDDANIIKHDVTLQNLLSTLPTSVHELLTTGWMKSLENIILDRNNPNQLLAICVRNMLIALTDFPEKAMSSNIIQRISIFLAMGVNLHSYNYERFSFTVYAIVHEISLLIHESIQKGFAITNFNKFKATMERDCISSLGLKNQATNNYKTISSPATSGANAFITALGLAKKMILSKERMPVIKAIGSIYYEFNKFITPSLSPHPELDDSADIYHISAGPIVGPDGITPGTDINKLIMHLMRDTKQTWPVTLLVDVTTGLHQNLNLDSNTKELVEQGKVSIICYESYQKFGLIHTDQLQAGAVYGICSNESYNDDLINQFELNAKEDFENHFDMIVASFLHENCGSVIELIKKRHFENGKLFNDFFKNPTLSLTNFSMELDNLNELYFLVASDPDLINAIKANVAYRQSFGHFSTTYSNINDKIRLSPNASDPTDIIIQIFQINLSMKFNKDELYKMLYSILCHHIIKEKPLANEQQILLSALLMSLYSMNPSMHHLKNEEKILLTIGISQLVSSNKKSILSRSHNQFLYNKIINQESNSYLLNHNPKYLLASLFDHYSNKEIFQLFQDEGYTPGTLTSNNMQSFLLFNSPQLPLRRHNRESIEHLNNYIKLETNYDQRETAKKMICLLKNAFEGNLENYISEREYFLLKSGELGKIIEAHSQASEILKALTAYSYMPNKSHCNPMNPSV